MRSRTENRDLATGPASEITLQAKIATEIYENYGKFLYKIIHANVRNESDADDIFQQFFLSLLTSSHSDIKHVPTYARRAIRNDIIDLVRTDTTYNAHLFKYQEVRESQANQDENNPVTALARKERIKSLFRFIKSHLPRHEREVVIRKHYHGEPAEGIAKSMGINQRSVSRYLCTGTKKLRQAFNVFRYQQDAQKMPEDAPADILDDM